MSLLGGDGGGVLSAKKLRRRHNNLAIATEKQPCLLDKCPKRGEKLSSYHLYLKSAEIDFLW